MWAEPQRRLVFDLGIRKEAAPREKISQSGPRLGPIGVQALGGDELGRRALERLAIGGRLACGWNRGKQRHGADAHAAIGIGEQRRHQRPDFRVGDVCEHVERADPYHRIGVCKRAPRQIDIRGRDIRR